MRYMGSKRRFAKRLIDIMGKDRTFGQYWVEPFVGSASVIERVVGPRIGNDIHAPLINMFTALQHGWVPPEVVSEDGYHAAKKYQKFFPSHILGFVGFACSFGGIWFNSYARDDKGNNYARQGRNSLLKQLPKIKNVEFTCADYFNVRTPPRSLIYCDPPYEGTTKYANPFNHKIFWEWCRLKVFEGHTVFVSEYAAPNDFKCVMAIETVTPLNKNKRSFRCEKLFKHETQVCC